MDVRPLKEQSEDLRGEGQVDRLSRVWVLGSVHWKARGSGA